MPSGVSAISTSGPSKSRNSASGFRAASSASGGGGGRSMLLCIAAKARGGNPMGQPPPFCRCGASDHPERAHGLGDADEAGDVGAQDIVAGGAIFRSEEHTSELQSLMRISYAVFCLKKKKKQTQTRNTEYQIRSHIECKR